MLHAPFNVQTERLFLFFLWLCQLVTGDGNNVKFLGKILTGGGELSIVKTFAAIHTALDR